MRGSDLHPWIPLLAQGQSQAWAAPSGTCRRGLASTGCLPDLPGSQQAGPSAGRNSPVPVGSQPKIAQAGTPFGKPDGNVQGQGKEQDVGFVSSSAPFLCDLGCSAQFGSELSSLGKEVNFSLFPQQIFWGIQAEDC